MSIYHPSNTVVGHLGRLSSLYWPPRNWVVGLVAPSLQRSVLYCIYTIILDLENTLVQGIRSVGPIKACRYH